MDPRFFLGFLLIWLTYRPSKLRVTKKILPGFFISVRKKSGRLGLWLKIRGDKGTAALNFVKGVLPP